MTKYKSNDNIRGHVFSEPHICIVRHSHRHIAHNIFFYLRVQVKTERCTTPPPPRPPLLFSAPTTSPAVGPPYRVSKNTPYIALHTLPPLHNYCTSLTPPPPTVLHPALKHCHQLRLAAEEFLRRSSSAVLASQPPGITRGRTGIPQSGLRPVGISTQLGTTTFLDSILMCKHFILVN